MLTPSRALVRRPVQTVFVWGNGSLGQLGLGRRSTGRRIPVPVPSILEASETKPKASGVAAAGAAAAAAEELEELETLLARQRGVVDVAAGANHSVCVLGDGTVYSWGHGEYGQHGAAVSVSSSDLVDAFYFYVPRKVPVEADIVKITCGACFTLGLTRDGDVWSWGWNSHGK